MTDDRAEIVYVNPAWEKITGYSFREVKGKNPRILQSGKTPQRVYRLMWSHLKKMKPFISEEIINRKKNGRFFNIRTTTYPIKVRSRILYVQIFDDVTKSKKVQQYRSAFIKMAARDMRTPLASVAVLGELLTLGAGKRGPETMELREETAKLRGLSDTLVDIRSYEKGVTDVSLAVTDLGKLVKSTSTTVSNAWERRLIRVHDTLDRFVYIDAPRIRQVIMRLLESALSHGEPDSVVDVTVESRDGCAVVSVTSRGPRVAKKDLEQMFMQPEIGDTVDERGLGLYFASQIIKAHKGKIKVESRAGRNPSTTLYFTLPLRRSARQL